MLLIESQAGWKSETVRKVYKREKCFAQVGIRAPVRPACSLVIIPTEPSQPLLGFVQSCTSYRRFGQRQTAYTTVIS
jgi:hypothetical protein